MSLLNRILPYKFLKPALGNEKLTVIYWSKSAFCVYYRLLGGLLSAHLLIIDNVKYLGDLELHDYDNELLDMAHDLAARLLPAFDNTKTGIPHPRVSWWFTWISKFQNKIVAIFLHI